MNKTPSPNELFRRFVFVLFKHKWLVIDTFLLTLVVIFAGVYLVDPAYKATAKILVRHNPQQKLVLFQDLETPRPLGQLINPAQNLVEFSTSRGMAEIVVKRFGLDRPKQLRDVRDYVKYWSDWIVNSPVTLSRKVGLLEDKPPNYLAVAVEELLDDIQDIRVRQDTEVIDLSIWGPTPELASGIANGMAELLVEKTREITRNQAEEAFEFAREQMVMVETSLHDAEEKLMQFKVEENIHSPKEERQLLLVRLDELRNAHTATIAGLREAEAQALEVKQQLSTQEPMLLSTSVMAANPVVKSLKSSQYELSGQLASEKVEKASVHPEVHGLQARIDELEARMAKESEMIPESETTVLNPIRQDLLLQDANLGVTVAALQEKTKVWQQEIEAVQDAMTALSQKEPALERLLREKITHEERFKTLKTKLLELEVQRLTVVSDFDVRVIDPARVLPNVDPDYPDWEVATYAALAISLILALGLPFLVEYVNDGFDTPSEVENALDMPVLGTVPAASGQKEGALGDQ